MLDRSESLKSLIGSFLEPDITQRIRIRDVFQHIWIKSGNIKTPLEIHKANELAELNKSNLNIPIITKNNLKSATFHYEVTDRIKSISAFNDVFTTIEDQEEDIFRN